MTTPPKPSAAAKQAEISITAKDAASEICKFIPDCDDTDTDWIRRYVQSAINQALAAQAASTAEDVQDMMRDGEHIADLVAAGLTCQQQLKERDEDINRLNQMIRDTGVGQGSIDAYVAQCEELRLARERLAMDAPLNMTTKIQQHVASLTIPLQQQIADLTRDKERLDWLDEHFCPHMREIIPKSHLKGSNFIKTKTVRDAIDAARRG